MRLALINEQSEVVESFDLADYGDLTKPSPKAELMLDICRAVNRAEGTLAGADSESDLRIISDAILGKE